MHDIFLIHYCASYNTVYIWPLHKATGQYYDVISEISITGDVYGFIGLPVRLACADTTVNGREELAWIYDSHRNLRVAKGIYVNGNLADAVYYKPLAGGRAELARDGSLIIHSYEDRDAGEYWCISEYRSASSHLTTIGMSFWLVT